MSDPDPYAVLGLSPGCSADDIRRAYRRLAREHHPDRNGGAPEAVRRAQEINGAHDLLGDPARRRAYDQDRGHAAPAAVRRAGRPAPLAQDVMLRLDELFRGASLEVRVNDPANPDGPETYPLVVPPDTAPGTRFRLVRAGTFAGGAVMVRVKLRPDFRFKARGADLRCDLRITAQRAEQGGTESLRGPSGQFLRVVIPRHAGRHDLVRIPGEGLPRPRGGRGDLLVRLVYRPDIRISRLSR